jgi:hypothetical protein
MGLCFLLVSFPVHAQTTTGSIVGTITDATGSSVPNASVTATNEATGIEFKVSTDSAGAYVVTPIPVGRYTVTVETKGFKKAVRSGIIVNVQDRVAVNLALEVGEISQTVEVQAAAPTLQTESSYLGQVVESQRIVDLPLNGRYFTRLAVLTSGTAPTPNGARDEKTGGFSSNGVRPYQNNYLLDGIDNNSLSEDMTNEAAFVYGPSPDAIEEFKVQTNSMSAEFGRSGGAVMNVTIKSGSNGFHGSAFEFLRNEKLDAKNYFDPPDQPTPPYKQNQFGGAIGGPIVKNKTFFFGDYQGTRIRQSRTFLATVAPPAWREGDFSGFLPIYDPSTTVIQGNDVIRQQFQGNRIPSNLFDPVAVKLIQWMPLPNVPGDVSAYGVANNYLTNPVLGDRTDQFDVRVDHKFSEKDSIFGRFSMANNTLSPPAEIPPPLSSANFNSGDWTNNTRSAVLSETHIFSPRVINEARLGYSRLRTERLQFNSNDNLSAQIGLPGIPFGPGNGGLPQFDIYNFYSYGSATYQPTQEFGNVWDFIDTLSVIHGKHTLKFGVEWKPQVNFSILQPPYPRGEIGFSNSSTSQYSDQGNTGLSFADFLLGKVDNAQIGSFINDTFQQPGYFFFVQDDFKVTNKLTLNLGIRYEFVSHARERRDAQANYNVTTGALDIPSGRQDPLPANFFPEVPINRNAPRQLVPQDRNNFAPRVGFAYQLNSKTVLRSGFGIFYSSYEAGPLSIPNPGNNPPFFLQSNFQRVSFTQPDPLFNQLSQGYPLDALSNPAAPSLFSFDPGFRNPYVQHWNMSIQRELGWNTVWEASYAGSAGKKLYEFFDANQAAPTTDPNSPANDRRPRPFLGTGLTYWCACNSSTYHSLQTKAEKRFSNNLSFLGAYTFGKSLDERSQASLGFGTGDGFRDPINHRDWEKGRSDYDVRHRFVVSYTYLLPWGQNSHGATKLLLNGWQLIGIHSFMTGTPFTVRAQNDFSNAGGDSNARPNVVPGVSVIPEGGQTRDHWFNTAAFTNPELGQFGNVGRNTLSRPNQTTIDFSIFKNFQITEGIKLQFRTEFFNLPNHPNFIGSPGSFRSFDSSSAGVLTQAAPGRQIQFALKFIF